MQPSFTWKGGGPAGFAGRLIAAKVVVGKMTEAEADRLGREIVTEAKKIVPVDTGNLQSSIDHEVSGNPTTLTVGSNVEYAAFVEYGTSRMDAQPYIRPAFDRQKGGVRNAFVNIVRVVGNR